MVYYPKYCLYITCVKITVLEIMVSQRSTFAMCILSLKSCFSRLHVKSFDKSNTCPYLQHESDVVTISVNLTNTL